MRAETTKALFPAHNRGATTVEYAVILVLLLLVLIGAVLWLANPGDENSLLPSTFKSVGGKVGNF
ncbi:MAG: hypothetical protein RQ723_07495, partial [Desulfuromonadales bacterium]|nr:hypothetical protein [Desulfuromonadales bacterium]